MKFERTIFTHLLKRLQEPRRFIQVLAGPRQVGKTTLALQASQALTFPSHIASADAIGQKDLMWLEQQWEIGRLQLQNPSESKEALLILDEAQKIPQWSSTIKKLWDQDSLNKLPLKVLLLGSSPLLLQNGLTESLAGRFEVIPVPHWPFQEMKTAFGWSPEQFVFFGGYPGAAPLIADEKRWHDYVKDSLIETTVAKDILLMTRVDKPALLKRLLHLGCLYSGQIFSYQKMLGQLQDVGNTTTLTHYLELLSVTGMLTGLPKYVGTPVQQKASSPKLQVLNTALMSVMSEFSFPTALQHRDFWGRLVESAVGAHLINGARVHGISVFYWRDRNYEVDFVLQKEKKLVAIEVKSGRNKGSFSGMQKFAERFKPKRLLLIGKEGIPLEKFLSTEIDAWF